MTKQSGARRSFLDPLDWILTGIEAVVGWFEQAGRRSSVAEGAGRATRRAAVKREKAKDYLFLAVLSFAVSVTVTRFFLELTGYPQIGNEELHIAHVLWGGLLLFLACGLLLALANRWVYSLGAIMAGAGLGLFIDEVGKFITQSNDYFYPFAAPIIYLLFILTLRLHIRLRRPADPSPRAVLYRVFERMTEVLDMDLEDHERSAMYADLARISEVTRDPNLKLMGQKLKELLESPDLVVVPTRLTRARRLSRWWDQLHARPQAKRQFIGLLGAASLGLAVRPAVRLWTLLQAVMSGLPMGDAISRLASPSRFAPSVSAGFASALVGLEGIVGLALLLGGLLIILHRERPGTRIFRSSLWFYVGVLNIPLFYFNQFSALGLTIFQFLVLWSLTEFRARHLPEKPQPAPAGDLPQ